MFLNDFASSPLTYLYKITRQIETEQQMQIEHRGIPKAENDKIILKSLAFS